MYDIMRKDVGDEILACWAAMQDYDPRNGRVFADSAHELLKTIAEKLRVRQADVYTHPLWRVVMPALTVREALMFKMTSGKHKGQRMGEVDVEYLRSLVEYGVNGAISSMRESEMMCKVATWQYAAATALIYRIRERWCFARRIVGGNIMGDPKEDAARYIYSQEPVLWGSLDLLAPVQSTIKERETCGTSKGSKASKGAKKRGKGKSEDTQLLFGV